MLTEMAIYLGKLKTAETTTSAASRRVIICAVTCPFSENYRFTAVSLVLVSKQP